jgi:hypothetical protein
MVINIWDFCGFSVSNSWGSIMRVCEFLYDLVQAHGNQYMRFRYVLNFTLMGIHFACVCMFVCNASCANVFCTEYSPSFASWFSVNYFSFSEICFEVLSCWWTKSNMMSKGFLFHAMSCLSFSSFSEVLNASLALMGWVSEYFCHGKSRTSGFS